MTLDRLLEFCFATNPKLFCRPSRTESDGAELENNNFHEKSLIFFISGISPRMTQDIACKSATFEICCMLEELVRDGTRLLGIIVDAAAALIIAHAVMRAMVNYTRIIAKHETDKLEVRLDLGKSLALALEFLLAADILRTAVAPNWDDIGKLAAIAALRTLLNYFLERELKHV